MIRFLRHEVFWAEKQALNDQSAGRAQPERDPPWLKNRQRHRKQAKPRQIPPRLASRWLRSLLIGLHCGLAWPDWFPFQFSTSLRSVASRSRWFAAFRKFMTSTFRRIGARL